MAVDIPELYAEKGLFLIKRAEGSKFRTYRPAVSKYDGVRTAPFSDDAGSTALTDAITISRPSGKKIVLEKIAVVTASGGELHVVKVSGATEDTMAIFPLENGIIDLTDTPLMVEEEDSMKIKYIQDTAGKIRITAFYRILNL